MTFDPEQALRSVAAPDSPPDMGTAADAAGLLDVAYATDDFPVGRLLLAATPGGLVRLAYLQEPAHQDAVLDAPRRELEEYFAGRRRRFEVALDWRLVRGFGRRVLEATARIPFGAVSTY